MSSCILHHHRVAQWLCFVNHLTEIFVSSWESPVHTNKKWRQTETQRGVNFIKNASVF